MRAAGGGLAPIFAQQSIREMERTGRSPREVLDDATWGVFAEGWQEGFGADADHLKTAEDIDACVAAGYSSLRSIQESTSTTGLKPLAPRRFAQHWRSCRGRISKTFRPT